MKDQLDEIIEKLKHANSQNEDLEQARNELLQDKVNLTQERDSLADEKSDLVADLQGLGEKHNELVNALEDAQ